MTLDTEKFPVTTGASRRASDVWKNDEEERDYAPSQELPPDWKVSFTDGDYIDWLVECPHCDNGAIVHGPTWRDGIGDEQTSSTRVCLYCGEEATVMVPKGALNRGIDA